MEYAVFLALAFLCGGLVRRAEVRRLGMENAPGHAWLVPGALVGALVGAKLGMLLYETPREFVAGLASIRDFDFTGKSVVGGLIGGFGGVEATKRLVGVRERTGDAWAVALPVAQGIGRVGCFLHGCCGGALRADGSRYPVQLVESVLDLALAGALWSNRRNSGPAGTLFRLYLVGYAAIRFGTEWVRGDRGIEVGPLSAVQIVCLLAIGLFGSDVVRSRFSGSR